MDRLAAGDYLVNGEVLVERKTIRERIDKQRLGALEVDLLCDDARVAVELDGAQHLSDPAAYRRDRRKDQLLQENGYLVLRFFAEDVGKELNLVLDSILRALNHRGSPSAADVTAIPAMLRMAGVPARR